MLLSGLLAGTSPGVSAAATGPVVVKANADSFVSSGAPSSNRGTAGYLQLDASPLLRGYVRFTVPVPTGERVSRALLTVTPNTSNAGITVRPAANTWTETGLTYRNAPVPASTTVRSGALTAGVPLTLDVTALLPATGGQATLVLDGTTGTSFSVRSREHRTGAPTLTVSTAAGSTETVGDTLAPTVVTSSPAPSATGVPVTAGVRATFSEDVQPATVSASTVTLVDAAGTTVAAAVSYDVGTRSAVLAPVADLRSGTTYTARVRGGSTGVKDLAGNALAADDVRTFSTAAAAATPVAPQPAGLPTGPVTARVETVGLSGMSGDIADDTAIWVDPVDPSRSVVIGTNKAASGGGIAVYDLSGRLLQFRADGKLNNVDLRSGTSVGGRPTVVVTASNRSTKSLAIYRFDPSTRQLSPIAARTVSTSFEPYGLCMYRSARTGSLYAFVTQENGGNTDQYELFDNAGKVDARMVRRLFVGSLSEGCVADDELGHLYVAEEDKGIWKYGAEPAAGSARTALAEVGDGRLQADVEGMALATRPGGGGHLVVSSQGSSSYAVYERATGTWVRSFTVGGSGTVDGASQTDGLDLVTTGLGTAFPHGLLVVHDATNTGGASSNYKYVDLAQVLGA